MKRIILLLAVIAIQPLVLAEKKPRKVPKPDPPTQANITKECLTVADIHSRYNRFADAYLVANVINGCSGPVSVSITVAYYNKDGIQFDTGYSFATIAPGSTWRLIHTPILDGDKLNWRIGKIVSISALTV